MIDQSIKLAIALAQQKARLKDSRSTAMKEYKKKKKAREAAVGFTNLVGGLKDVTSANAGRGGALGIFGVSKFSICSLGHKCLPNHFT